MTTPPDSLNPSASPERREQIQAFEELFWKHGTAIGDHGTGFYDGMLAAWLAACDYRNAWRVVAIDGLPKSGVPVIAFVINAAGKSRRIRAMYAAEKTLPLDADCDDPGAVFDEETDTLYCPEGWYETNEYEETHWGVSDPVTHWMPLPEAPR